MDQQFIDDTLSVDKEKGEIIISLQNIIAKACPDVQKEIKYGGLVFNQNTELICGIFIYQKHISIEFSFGHEFSDPSECLEGSGKFRRHIKIMHEKDIENKQVKFFVSQAFDH